MDKASSPTIAAERRRVVSAAVVGNIAEYYDFSLFIFLSTTIGRAFFPAEDPAISTLASLAAFGAAFLARPFGGFVFGMAADRLGRKAVMLLTFATMAIATVGIGLLPDYSVIGIWAPILIVVLRLLQGISAGGEWGTSMSYGVEWAPQNRRALFGSFIQAGNAIGTVISTAVVALLILIFGSAAFEEWAWRLAFLFGIAIVPIGVYLRNNAGESPAFEAARAEQARLVEAEQARVAEQAGPVGQPVVPLPATGRLSRGSINEMILFFTVMCLPSAAIPTTAKYLPTFAEQYADVSKSQAMWATSFSTMLIVLMTPFMGMLSDRVGRRPLLLASIIIYAVVTWPLFTAMAKFGGIGWMLAAQCIFAIATALTYGAIGATLVEMFATTKRAGKLSTLHSVQIAIFGGFSPLAAGFFIRETGDPAAMSYYLLPMAVISLIAVARMRETAFTPLR